MNVEVHTYLVDAHSLRTRSLSYFGCNVYLICGEMTSLFLLVVRSILCYQLTAYSTELPASEQPVYILRIHSVYVFPRL